LGDVDEMVRAARNQSLYRSINEKVMPLNEAFSSAADVEPEWICECADQACVAPMYMTFSEYEGLRSRPNRFAVLHGHVDAKVERVVEETENYVVVEKLGPGAAVAVETDPRSAPPAT
jgi:hypothetical protein